MSRPILHKRPRPVIYRNWLFEFPWEGTFERWSRQWVNRNFWRVQNYFGSKEDALQECALIFSRCADRYAGRVDNLAWFMSLYQTAVSNEWHTISVKETQMRELAAHSDDVRIALYEPIEDKFVAATQTQTAVDEIKLVLLMIANAPAEIIEFVFSAPEPNSLNRRLKRLSGISASGLDIVSALKEYFS